MSKPGVSRISISLPPALLEDFDAVITDIGYDRSKAIQQAMRDFISEYQWDAAPSTSAVGTVTIIYDHDVSGLESELTAIQHQHTDLITSATHIHLDSHQCLLVIVVKGPAVKIKQLASKLQGLRGIHQLKVTSLMEALAPTNSHSH